MKEEKNLKKLKKLYLDTYGEYGGCQDSFERLLETIDHRIRDRSDELRYLDQRPHDWYMSQNMIGMMLYVDLFSGQLKDLVHKIPYLLELGITYVHLMPLLKPRQGENDGGYAVEDYCEVDPVLGSMDDFKDVLDEFRHSGIDVCIDYVLNHTANTHEWAKKALEGDLKYQDMYLMYQDREIPDKYDRTVPEVLPDKSPGNFTYIEEIDKWVFTSFSSFQWDLNFKNPYVFEKIVDIMLYLANLGVNILRLDAIAFMWKEEATSCRNHPKVHRLLSMLNLIKEIAAPSLVLLGEAIVEPDEIFKYFGTENEMECGILYNANMMVNIFNTLATRDVRLLQIDNSRFRVPVTGCFMNYVRCHDDIGWGLSEIELSKLGFDPYQHKKFLIDFYSRDFKGSFSKGEIYQYNPLTHDARTNGTLASLLGLEKSKDENDIFGRFYSINRIKLVHALIFSHRGIPLIYSGDEIATQNDQSYLYDEHKKSEGRWVHRPVFDWKRAELRNDPSTDEGIVFKFIQDLAIIRKSDKLFCGKVDAHVIDLQNNNIYCFYKENEGEMLICIYNFSEHMQKFSNYPFKLLGCYGDMYDLVTGKKFNVDDEHLYIYPYEFLWLKSVK